LITYKKALKEEIIMSEEIGELIKEISEKSGKEEKEIKEMIDAKIKKFSGLLTDQGAAFMVQKELGLKQETSVESKVDGLEEGMKNIELKGIVKSVFPVKEFEKNGKQGKLKSFILEDDTGGVRVTLWNDQVDKYDLTIGSEVQLNNVIVSSYNEKKQVSLGFNGTIDILNKKEIDFEKINNLKGGMNGINVVGRLLRKFPCKEFNSGERKGKLCNFQFGDESALLRATAWNEKADEVQALREGDVVEIKNGYTKEGMFGVELHLGYTAELKESEKAMPGVTEILKEQIKEKKINVLVENENVIVKGKIKEILPGNFYFNACEKCGRKVSGTICESCGEIKGEKRAVLSAIIEDDTGEIKANLFSESALNLLNWKQEDLEKETTEKSSEKLLEEINNSTKGKEIGLFGYNKMNSYSNENEFSVKEVL
jgi:replication factor A1